MKNIVQLKDICDLQNGFAFKSEDYIDHSNTLNCRMSNVRPDGNFDIDYAPKYLPDDYALKYSDYLLHDGDLVIAMTDMANDPKILGVPTIVKTNGKKLLLNQRVGKLIITKKENVHVLYLQYALNRSSVKKYYTKFAGGGLQLNVGKKEILSVQIPLPQLPTQKKIAAILDAADTYRQKTKALIDKYDQLAQSLFLEIFGDTWTNPKGWKVMLVEEVSNNKKHSIKAGPFGSSLKKEFYVEKGYKIYGQEQVIKDDLSFGDYYIDEKKYKELENCKVSEGDVLISLVGTYGKISVVPENFEPGIINPRLMKISPNRNIIRPDFLKLLLQNSGAEIQMKNQSRGGTMDIVNVGIMRKIEIPVPPIELQNKFAERAQLIEAQKQQARVSLQKAEDLFNSLLQRAFKGELVE